MHITGIILAAFSQLFWTWIEKKLLAPSNTATDSVFKNFFKAELKTSYIVLLQTVQ